MRESINILRNRKRVFLYHIKADKTIVRFYMEPLSDKTEKLIDNLSNKGIDGYFVNSEGENIFLRDIVLYGDIDINNEEDKDLIRKSNILNEDNGFYAHPDFNYEDACIYRRNGIIREHQSWDKIKFFKERHCLINKAPKIIIYKYRTKIYGNQKLVRRV